MSGYSFLTAHIRAQLLTIDGITDNALFRTLQLPVAGIHEQDQEYKAATVYSVAGGEPIDNWEGSGVRLLVAISIRDLVSASERDLDNRAEAVWLLFDDDDRVTAMTPIVDAFITELDLVAREFTVTAVS